MNFKAILENIYNTNNKKYQYTPLLFRQHYGIICAVPTGKREYPKANENNKKERQKKWATKR